MKIGVSSYDFKRYKQEKGCSDFEIIDLAKSIGFDGIEFVEFNNADCDVIEYAKKIRAHCESVGLEVIAYTTGANLLSDNIDEEIKKAKKNVDITEALGAKVMRHDVTFRLKDKPRYTYKDAIRDAAPHIREITEYAKKKGIRTCTENHGYILQAPERVEELMLAVDNDNFGWLIDIGNFLCTEYSPARCVGIASRYAFHVHVKDFVFKSGNEIAPAGMRRTSNGDYIRGTVLGHGCVPVKQCIDILKNSGYDGWVSIEFEGLEETIKALELGLDYLKRII